MAQIIQFPQPSPPKRTPNLLSLFNMAFDLGLVLSCNQTGEDSYDVELMTARGQPPVKRSGLTEQELIFCLDGMLLGYAIAQNIE